MPSPKISFVLPSFNSAAWLPHAVASCQKQKYSNLEIIVVDDCSTDTTRQVMEYMSKMDNRISYYRLEKNMGQSYARNFGNERAEGKYILVLDADDLSLPDRARLTVKKLERADFVYGGAETINAAGIKMGIIPADVFNKAKCLKDKVNYMVHSTCAYTKEISQKFKYSERDSGPISDLGLDDWALQIQIALSGAKLDHISVPISVYRILPNSASQTRNPKDVHKAKDAFMESLKVTC